MLFSVWTSITEFLDDPIVLFTALTAIGAVVAAIAAMNANKPNSREKTDILKCEILNYLQNPIGLQVWVKLAALNQSTPAEMSKLLDIERSKQIFPNILRKGVLGKIFKSRKYGKYKWRVYIIGAMSELQREGYENVSIGTANITQDAVTQWSYEQTKSILIDLGIPEDEVDKYMKIK